MKTYNGVVESPLNSIYEAFNKLKELDNNEEFEQTGDLKIVEVHYVRA
ncbi:MAG: hypothetical protein ACOCUI_00930 [bacterium]